MADLRLGSNEISSAFVGANEVSEIYLGSTKVWPNSEPVSEYLEFEAATGFSFYVTGSVAIDRGSGSFTSYSAGTLINSTGRVRVDLGSATKFYLYGGTWNSFQACLTQGPTEIYSWGTRTLDAADLMLGGERWGTAYTCEYLTKIPATFEGIGNANLSYMFRNCSALTSVASWAGIEARSLASVSYAMFENCTALASIPSSWVGSHLDTAENMFKNCTSLASIPASWNGFSAFTTNYCFSGCTSLTSIPSSWEGCSVMKDTAGMFYGCTGLTSIPDSWEYLKVWQTASGMFSRCTGLTSIPAWSTYESTMLSGSLSSLFSGCTGLTTLPSWTGHPNRVMSGMFSHCTGLTSIPPGGPGAASLYSYCTGLTTIPAVTGGSSMFSYCTGLTTLPSSWSGFTSASRMFYGCSNLATIPSVWTGLSGSSTEEMFVGTAITAIPTSWSGLVATNTSGMFKGLSITSIPSVWTGLESLVTADSMFANTSITSIPSTWAGLTSLASAEYMFSYCTALTTFSSYTGLTALAAASYMFEHSGLTSSPASFAGFSGAEDISYMFSECTALVSGGTTAFTDLSGVTNVEGLYYNNSARTTNISDLFDYLIAKATEVTDFADAFAGCDGAVGYDDILSTWGGGDSGSVLMDLAVYTTDMKTGANVIFQAVMVTNNDSVALASGWSVRYWYTLEQAGNETVSCWGKPSGWSTPTANGDSTAVGAIRYFEYVYNSELAAGASTPSSVYSWDGQISQSRWGSWTKTNDYSYNGQFGTTYAANTKVTVYNASGGLVYGTEPV